MSDEKIWGKTDAPKGAREDTLLPAGPKRKGKRKDRFRAQEGHTFLEEAERETRLALKESRGKVVWLRSKETNTVKHKTGKEGKKGVNILT